MKRLFLAVMVLALSSAGCLTDSDDDEYLLRPVPVDSVRNARVSPHSVTFDVFGTVADPCWQFNWAEIWRRAEDISVKIHAKRKRAAMCPQVLTVLKTRVQIPVTGAGTYEFHFWASDSASVDTTVVVR